jgi:YfiH family protein
MFHIYPFTLEFISGSGGKPYCAVFPFIVDGVPLSGISCAISSRFAGDMAYTAENPARLALFKTLRLPPVYGLHQIHSRNVLAVDEENPPACPADGMVCAGGKTALSVTVADCLPVYLFDTASGACGLAHSGWKGTGIALECLELMRERRHTRPEETAAVLGPCIGPCCYTVDAERAAAFEKRFGAVPPGISGADAARLPPVTRHDGAAWYLDLRAANIRLLAGAGVRDIAVCGNCTFDDKRLSSYRREGADHYTRMAALLWRPSPV